MKYTIHGLEEIPTDPKNPAADEEAASLEANKVEADLEEKDRLAGCLSGKEEIAGLIAEVRGLWERDPDRFDRLVASSNGPKDAGSPADDHPGVRADLSPEDPCRAELGHGERLPAP